MARTCDFNCKETESIESVVGVDACPDHMRAFRAAIAEYEKAQQEQRRLAYAAIRAAIATGAAGEQIAVTVASPVVSVLPIADPVG